MSGRFKHCRPERRSPAPVFGVTEPDHSRPRHGKILTKSITPPPSRRRSRERRPRPGPSRRSPPRGRPPPPPPRYRSPIMRSPPRNRSPMRSPPRHRSPLRIRSPPRHRSPLRSPPRHRSPLRSPPRHRSPLRSPPRHRSPLRSPPRHRSPLRSPPRHRSPLRSPPRHRSSIRIRSPARNRSPLRTRSPPRSLRIRSPPPPRSPLRARTPPRSHRSPRRRSPPVTQEQNRGRRHSPSYLPSPPPPPRNHSPQRHHTSRSPRRVSGSGVNRAPSPPLYQNTESYKRDFSPVAAPRVPRDQRTPPMIQPPRPRHLRSPRREEVGEKQKSGSSSSSKAKSDDRKSKAEKDRRGHSDSQIPATAPPPPSISSPKSSLLPRSSSSSSSAPNVSYSSTGTSSDWAVFRGPEQDDIDIKELKRIQIDIRRNLPNPARSDEPVIRKLGEKQKLFIPRRPQEGRSPLFQREDIKANAVPEEKPEKREQKIQISVAPLEEYERRLGGEIAEPREEKREREESPRSETRDVRARLGDRESSGETHSPPERRDVRERLGLSIKDRLGEQLREEEAEFRPRVGGPRHYRGGRRGRGRGYRGGRGDWKYHDKYQEDELPSSTTD